MPHRDLQEFMAVLEREGELRRVKVEADPELEIAAIATRLVREGGPALLFERPKGSPYPLLINQLATERRIELALGRHPKAVGEELIGLVERLNPPSLKELWRSRGLLWKLGRASRRKDVRSGPAQEVVEAPGLGALPAIKCWPGDGGRFLTLPLVRTLSPATGRSNLGIYRMQVYGPDEAGMHWQIQKGGGFHYAEAEALGRPLEVAAVLGGDPALFISAVLPLPESMEELLFATILRGAPTPMVPAKTLAMRVPANAEFVLEGAVEPNLRRMEGPFGDHFGHYSHAAEFPVFRINVTTRRRNPVFPAAVVGKPPAEDTVLGYAVQDFLNPFLKLLHPEIEDLHAYGETGFVNLAAASVKSRYHKEPLKVALGLFGTGQLSLTKCVVLVGPGVDPGDFDAVLREIRANFDPRSDFLLLPRVPFDTLDFASFRMHEGSKMALDATPKRDRAPSSPPRPLDLGALGPGVAAARLWEDCMLIVKTEGAGRPLAERLAADPRLAGVKVAAVVSADVDLDDRTSALWGVFTRFDPARDVVFPSMRMEGAAAVYEGSLVIDASWKPGYPDPLETDPDTAALLERRWDEYWS